MNYPGYGVVVCRTPISELSHLQVGELTPVAGHGTSWDVSRHRQNIQRFTDDILDELGKFHG